MYGIAYARIAESLPVLEELRQAAREAEDSTYALMGMMDEAYEYRQLSRHDGTYRDYNRIVDSWRPSFAEAECAISGAEAVRNFAEAELFDRRRELNTLRASLLLAFGIH